MKDVTSTFMNDIANSKLLLYTADFTESSYYYTASVWHCPVKSVEHKEKAKKGSSDIQTAFFLGCARIAQGSPQSHLALWGEEAQRNG